MQLVGADQILRLLRDLAVSSAGSSSGLTGVSRMSSSTVAQRSSFAAVRLVAHQMAHQRLGHGGVDAVHATCGRRCRWPSPGPARTDRRCRPPGRRCWLARSISTWVRSRAWRVFIGHVAARSRRGRCPRNGCATASVMSISLKRHAQLVAQDLRRCCGCGRWCRSRAWSRPGCPSAARPSRSMARTATSSARQESSPPEMPMHGGLGAGVLQPLGKARRPGCAGSASQRSARAAASWRHERGGGRPGGSGAVGATGQTETQPSGSRPPQGSKLVMRRALAEPCAARSSSVAA